jgi:hypothetical protein
MGMGPIRCMIGFSTSRTNEFSEFMERRARELDQRFRVAHTELLKGLSSLHDSVDSALCNDKAQAAINLNRGLAELAGCNENLRTMIASLASSRADLATRHQVDSCDPLVQREFFFSLIDWDHLYNDLASSGAALPQRVFWDEVVVAIQAGGTQGALTLLEFQLEDLRVNLCNYFGRVNAMRNLSTQELAQSLHNISLSPSALIIGFIRFLTSCTYVSLACGRAMSIWEQKSALAVEAA